jgi:phage baseplate assembly protein W
VTVITGVLLPFVVTGTGDVASGSGDDLAIAKVELVLGTRPGEVDWRPDFGCGIHLLRHQNNTPVLTAMATYYIRTAFVKWLTSYTFVGVKPTIDGRSLTLAVYFNQRSASGAPLFPRDLSAQAQVALVPSATITS